MVHKLDVRCVPLKPSLDEIKKHMESKDVVRALQNSVDGAQHLVPIQVLDVNIGSNEGLTLHLEDVLKRNTDGRVKMIVADENIFYRLMKVFNV